MANARSSKKQERTPNSIHPGDYVTNSLKPEWGPGRVVDVKRDIAFVFWRDRPGKEVIRMKPSFLQPAERDPELEAIAGYVEKGDGFALGKGKKGAKGKSAAKTITFEIPDEIEIEEIEIDPEEMEMEPEEE